MRVSALGAFVAGSGTVLAACGGGEHSEEATHNAPVTEAPAAEASEAAQCDDLSAMSEADQAQSQQLRQSLGYVDQSVEASKNCSNCALFVAAEAGAACGGCNLIKGPISPSGYCNSWSQKPA